MRVLVHNPRSISSALGLLLAALGVGACNATGARVHNLGELHTDDGYHRQSAELLSSWEWTIRSAFQGALGDRDVSLGDSSPQKVDDANETCLDNLVQLGLHTGEGGYQRAARIGVYARLVVNCPWKLSRERCVILLGREGRELDMAHNLTRPLRGPAVDADQLVGALGELLAAARPGLEGRGEEADPAVLRASCERLAAFDYDLDGARRSMGMVALIARKAPAKNADFDCVRELDLRLQRATVDRALRAALVDAQPFERTGTNPGWGSARVRAAALEACLVAYGQPVLLEFIGRLDSREEVEVLLALMRGVALVGLPEGLPGVAPSDYAAVYERAIETLVTIAMDHPDGRARTAAMYALERVSDHELSSLREEDWFAWATARAKARAALSEAEREALSP